MIDLNPSRNLAARSRSSCFPAWLLLAGLLALVTPLRADNPPTYLFQIDATAVPGGAGFEPNFVALDAGNNVYVTDYDNSRIVNFTRLGMYLRQWGNVGSGNGQIEGPQGIAVDSRNNVYVADDITFSVEKFDTNGNYLTQWDYKSGNGEFDYTYFPGVAVDSSDHVYVTAPQNALVQKFTTDGIYLTQWGSGGNGNGQFSDPFGVAVDSSNNVYVADTDNSRIEKFDSNGNYLLQWGSAGSGNGQFEYPYGVAVDSSNNVYVADSENDRVEKFDSNGNYLTQWGGAGSGNGQFNFPVGIAVDSTGNYIFVADHYNSRIEVFVYNANIVPPIITSQPVTQAVAVGTNVTLSVGVVGVMPLAYQWTSNRFEVAGATNASFTLSNVSLSESGGAYSVLVTNSYGSNLSSVAVLTILPAAEFLPPIYLSEFGSYGSGYGQLFRPLAVEVDNSNNIFVSNTGYQSDANPNELEKFDRNGNFLTQWGSAGSGNGQFQWPEGIAIDRHNDVYVADSLNARVQKFDNNGNYLTQWGGFMEPVGVAVDSSDNVYVADSWIDRVEKFDSNGNYLLQWGRAGSGNGQFQRPEGLAVDSGNNVYVADYGNDRVEKFDSNGNYLTQWGGAGSGNGQFSGPINVAVDSDNNVHVVDAGNDRVEKFDSNGDYLTQWGNGQFNEPAGVALDSTGNYIYVTDTGYSRIDIFVNNPNIIPPFITQQPTNEAVAAGMNVTLSAGVVGGLPLAYQWTSNNIPVPGPTNASFTLTNVPLSDSALYAVVVSNSYGSSISRTSALTVLPPADFRPPTYVFSIGSSAVPGGFAPNYLALDASNNVYVTDTLHDRVVKLTPFGTFLAQWGSAILGYPQGVALDSSNNVYVADAEIHSIEKFDSNGNYLTQWGGEGSGDGQFSSPGYLGPYGLAADSSNNVYVADLSNDRIEEFDSNGSYLTQWGSLGSGNGQFIYPAGVAVDSSNNIYVIDSRNFRVEKFDANGNYLIQWGSYGYGYGQFSSLTGCAVDSRNYVYVTDYYYDRVEKFDSNGDYLTQWVSGGPLGVAVDNVGNYIYLANDNQIDVFANNTNVIPPFITQQPANGTVPAGVNVTFSVGVVGAGPLSYQWTSNNVAVPGATNATFTLTNVGLSDSGNYSVLVTNSYGSNQSSNALLAVVPVIVVTRPASGISATGAALNGSVTLGSDETVVWFDWGTDTNYGNSAGAIIVPGNNATTNISSALSGLSGNVYHYRIVAANDLGIVHGNDQSFTVGFAPIATTLAAVNSTNGSTLNATVNPNGWDTTVYFQWGTSTPLTNFTPAVDIGAAATSQNVSSFITGLASFNPYAYQVVASNQLGTTIGAYSSFLAPPFSGAPLARWGSVASSADGTRLVAGSAPGRGSGSVLGGLYTSTNRGATWTLASNALEAVVASSADGAEMLAGNYSGIDISTNSGALWSATTAPPTNWNAIASSADGGKLAAVALNLSGVYTSTDSGVNWILQTNGLATYSSFTHIASSADGSKLVAAAGGTTNGPIFASTNSGVDWTKATNAPLARWYSVASSADGNKLLVCAYPGNVYLSTDAGLTWTETSLPTNNWDSVAESADGTKMVALANSGLATVGTGGGGIFTSTDSGATWVSNNVPSWAWTCAAMSADGNEIIATTGAPALTGGIYVSQTTPAPVLDLSDPDNNTAISWLIPSLDFTLQQSPDLSSWTAVTNLPVLNLTNLQNQVVLPPPAGNSFFRLLH